MIPRLYHDLGVLWRPGKVLLIYGPRRVGKTTLMKDYLAQQSGKWRWEVGEDVRLHTLFAQPDRYQLEQWIAGYDGIMIDEVQDIPNVGVGLKMLVDLFPSLPIIVSGSSSFSISQELGEPLVGRQTIVYLYPLSYQEYASYIGNPYDAVQGLEDILLYGMYPRVRSTTSLEVRQEELSQFVHALLLKDILHVERVKGSAVLYKLLSLLALYIGAEVSVHALAQEVGMDFKTVERYLDLLEKGFIITSLRPYATNTGKSLRKKAKYYFWDLGVRNALLRQWQPLASRNDTGALWENFFIIERKKFLTYTKNPVMSWFWRSYSGQEIDLVEQKDGRFEVYECKRSPKKHSTLPSQWAQEHQDSAFHLINPTTFGGFVSG